MVNPANLVRQRVREMPAYEPILPFEVLSDQLGRPLETIIKLDANENPYGPVPEVLQALGRLPFAHIYPDPQSRALREALAAYHGVPKENLLAGAGADELIDLIMRLFIEPGEAILSCPPTFGMYAFDGDINGASVVEVRRKPDFRLDVEAIGAAVERYQPKLIFLASPNNPDGNLLGPEELERLLSLHVVVVLDEAYVEFAPAGSSAIGRVPRRQNLIVLRTFSKWAGLAGLRVGYGAFPEAVMDHLWKIKQPYNLSVAASTAALVSLAHAQTLAANGRKIVKERERLITLLERLSWLQPYPSQANFVLCRVLGRDAGRLKADLAAQGILIRYFDRPGLSDHIRISVGRPEHTEALLRALREWE